MTLSVQLCILRLSLRTTASSFKHLHQNENNQPLEGRTQNECRIRNEPPCIHVIHSKVGMDIAGLGDGFVGSFIGNHTGVYDSGHLAQTYSALCCLLILDDDLQRVNRRAIVNGLAACQLADGSFCATRNGSENDMRFVYCAVAICHIIDDFSAISIDSVVTFIRDCLNYDGGIGQAPKLESHGGSTFCALASLTLLNRLWDQSAFSAGQLARLKRWCFWKQQVGFHGRANKPDDSCYSFWLGASLSLLRADSLIDEEKLRQFVLSTQNVHVGGFSKYTDSNPDALHSYFSLAGLSLLHEPGLAPISPALNLSSRTESRIRRPS